MFVNSHTRQKLSDLLKGALEYVGMASRNSVPTTGKDVGVIPRSEGSPQKQPAKHPFQGLVRVAATLGVGAGVAQVLGAIGIPLLARIYSVSDFGAFALFFVGSQMLGQVLALRFEQAIMLSTTRSDERVATLLSLVTATGIALAIGGVLALAAAPIDRAFGSSMGLAWPAMALAGLLTSCGYTLSALALKSGQNAAVTLSRLGKVACVLIIQLTIGLFFGANVWGLVVGETVGTAFSLWPLIRASRQTRFVPIHGQSFRKRVLLLRARVLIRRHIDLPRVNLPHVLVNTISGWSVLGFATMFFSPAEVGQFFMMQRIVALPASVAGIAVSQAFYAAAVQTRSRTGGFAALVLQIMVLQFALGLAVAIVLALFGDALFALVLGDHWRHAGHLASLYAPYVAIHLVLMSLAPTPIVAGRLRMTFLVAIGESGLYLIAFMAGALFVGSIHGAVLAACWMSIPYMAAVLAWYIRIAGGTPDLPGKGDDA